MAKTGFKHRQRTDKYHPLMHHQMNRLCQLELSRFHLQAIFDLRLVAINRGRSRYVVDHNFIEQGRGLAVVGNLGRAHDTVDPLVQGPGRVDDEEIAGDHDLEVADQDLEVIVLGQGDEDRGPETAAVDRVRGHEVVLEDDADEGEDYEARQGQEDSEGAAGDDDEIARGRDLDIPNMILRAKELQVNI
jgi:hypothetical protein